MNTTLEFDFGANEGIEAALEMVAKIADHRSKVIKFARSRRECLGVVKHDDSYLCGAGTMKSPNYTDYRSNEYNGVFKVKGEFVTVNGHKLALEDCELEIRKAKNEFGVWHNV